MSKYQIEAEFSLTTSIEAEGISFDEGDSEDFSDDSYFSGEEITMSGGQLRFVVEADDADEAERKAEEIVSDGNEVTDYNGFTWLVESCYFNVERVETPMTLERATEILQKLAEETDGTDADLSEAVEFILAHVAQQAITLADLKERVERLNADIAGLQAAQQAVTAVASHPFVTGT